MKKILITGCSGYIGSHLCKLLEPDYEIHGLDIIEPQHPVKEFFQVDINKPFMSTNDDEYVVLVPPNYQGKNVHVLFGGSHTSGYSKNSFKPEEKGTYISAAPKKSPYPIKGLS